MNDKCISKNTVNRVSLDFFYSSLWESALSGYLLCLCTHGMELWSVPLVPDLQTICNHLK